jgi:hypothetical protein
VSFNSILLDSFQNASPGPKNVYLVYMLYVVYMENNKRMAGTMAPSSRWVPRKKPQVKLRKALTEQNMYTCIHITYVRVGT